MESGTDNIKLKIVWICHFHDDFLNDYLKIERISTNFAPWIIALIKLFENDPVLDLHIIAPHKGIKKDTSFVRKNISYHFYSVGLPISNRFNVNDFDRFTNYFFLKRKVRKLINKIKPDIIHLHGAENPYYSSTIIQFLKNYNVLITIQGFISLTSTHYNYKLRDRIFIEKSILSLARNFGIRTQQMKEEILKHNKTAKFHWHLYPLNLPDDYEKFHNRTKIFHAVFFAKISKDKGIEDLIEAANIVKKKIPNFHLLVIGTAESKYLSVLKSRCRVLKLENNIEWKGFVNSHHDVFRYCSESILSVLPTYNDIIPGTIIESMILKTAVVAYSVGGIPEINKNNEVISLVECGNITALAEKMIFLIENELIRKKMIEEAFFRAKQMFLKDTIKQDLVTVYQSIIKASNI